MEQKEKIIEIIGHGLPREVAEIKADEILLLFDVSGNEALRVALPSETLKVFDELANCLFHESIIMRDDMDSIRESFNQLHHEYIKLIERGNDR